MELKVMDTMTVIDVDAKSIYHETVDFLQCSARREYHDNSSLKEHLYAITIDSYELAEATDIVKNQITQLVKLAEEHDAAYVRFVKF